MPQKKELLEQGNRVRITALRPDPEPGAPVPDDVIGMEGVIQWVTPGFAGEKGAFEVKLDDGRVYNFYATEIDPIEP
jgi:hypothetical protein